MDHNEMSFEALFRCSNFIIWDSPKLKKAAFDLRTLLKSKVSDRAVYDEISAAANAFSTASYESGFEQGFRFAVKLLRNLYDMSFPDVPPFV